MLCPPTNVPAHGFVSMDSLPHTLQKGALLPGQSSAPGMCPQLLAAGQSARSSLKPFSI